MKTWVLKAVFALVALMAPFFVFAAAAPQPVSPGSTVRILANASLCPTFSWNSTVDYERFELAVFEVTPGSQSVSAQIKPVAQAVIPGAGRNWTPSTDRCTEPGKTYTWLVRGLSASGDSEWSAEAWFSSPIVAGPDRQEISALLAITETAAPTQPQSSPADSLQVAQPELTVVEDMIVGEIAVIRDPGVSLGRITTSSDFESRSFTGLRAARFELLETPPSTGSGAVLSADLNASPGVTFKVGSGNCSVSGACDDIEVHHLTATGVVVESGPIHFSAGFENYSGSGGSGFFEVPSATQVRVDNNAAKCGGRPVVGVRLWETDTDQIGIQVECGNHPASIQ